MRTTHTFVVLELSQASYNEIWHTLEAADYKHAIHADGTIDMHGLAVVAKESPMLPPTPEQLAPTKMVKGLLAVEIDVAAFLKKT